MGLSEAMETNAALTVGAVIGGAMFGDNLSMISDTTIAAARTQNCHMKDKFRMNIRLVLPAAILSLVTYFFMTSNGAQETATVGMVDYIKLLPYLMVLVAAMAGMNVFLVLSLGIVVAGVIGLIVGDFTIWTLCASINKGMQGMAEIVIVSMLIGGLVEVVRQNGGINYILYHIGRRTNSRRGAELSIGLLTGVVNVFTANNTIAILMAGPIVKNIADRFEISPGRSASLMDTASCFVQGALPYGAQILAAVGLAGGLLSPFDIMTYLFYPYLMGVTVFISILIRKK
jgi:Na+/H+ antiporter NhaC